MDFRAPQARKFWEFIPPTQGIYIVFSAAGEKILGIYTAYTKDLHIFLAPQAINFLETYAAYTRDLR